MPQKEDPGRPWHRKEKPYHEDFEDERGEDFGGPWGRNYGNERPEDQERNRTYEQNRYGRQGEYYRERGGGFDLRDDYEHSRENEKSWGGGSEPASYDQRRGEEDDRGQNEYTERIGHPGRNLGIDYEKNRNPNYGRSVFDAAADSLTGPYAGVGPRGYRRSNERIREEALDRLTQHGQIDATEIDVEVENGEITLRGTVDSRRTKRLAEETVESIPGVRDVHNELRLRGPSEPTLQP